jgi:hypothetical protein
VCEQSRGDVAGRRAVVFGPGNNGSRVAMDVRTIQTCPVAVRAVAGDNDSRRGCQITEYGTSSKHSSSKRNNMIKKLIAAIVGTNTKGRYLQNVCWFARAVALFVFQTHSTVLRMFTDMHINKPTESFSLRRLAKRSVRRKVGLRCDSLLLLVSVFVS